MDENVNLNERSQLNSLATLLTDPARVTQPSRTRLFFWYWLPAIVWVALVATFSSSALGGAHTSTWMQKVLEIIGVNLTWPQFVVLHHLIRKSAHFTSYGILSVLLFRAFRGTGNPRRRWRMTWALPALSIAFLVASSDEIHQSFTPGREGMWQDVALDMMGATFAQIAIVVWSSHRTLRRR